MRRNRYCQASSPLERVCTLAFESGGRRGPAAVHINAHKPSLHPASDYFALSLSNRRSSWPSASCRRRRSASGSGVLDVCCQSRCSAAVPDRPDCPVLSEADSLHAARLWSTGPPAGSRHLSRRPAPGFWRKTLYTLLRGLSGCVLAQYSIGSVLPADARLDPSAVYIAALAALEQIRHLH